MPRDINARDGIIANPGAWMIDTAARVLPGVIAGGPRGPTDNQQLALVNAGYVRNETRAGRARMVTWTAPDGTVIGNERARGVARDIIQTSGVWPPTSGQINPRNPPPLPSPLPGPPPEYEPPEDKYGGWIGGPKCGTDTQCADWARDHGVPDSGMTPPAGVFWRVDPVDYTSAFTSQPWVKPPDWVKVATRTTPGIFGTILSRIFVLGTILFPSRTADDDVWDPEWIPKKKGPLRRPRIRRPATTGDPFPTTGPDTMPRARPVPYPLPGTRPGTMPRTGSPTGDPFPTPRPRAIPRPYPTPRPAPGMPTWFDPLLPLLLLARPTPRTPTVRLPVNVGQPTPQQFAQPQPFAFAQPQPRTDKCDCTKTKKKKKKDSCTNPIVSTRKRTTDGVLYRTITRKIQCQA